LNGEGDTDPVPVYVVITREIWSKVGDLANQTRHHIAHTHTHTRSHTNALEHKHTYIELLMGIIMFLPGPIDILIDEVLGYKRLLN